MPEIVVEDRPEKERYVVDVDGVEAGFAVYHIRAGDLYFFVHTEIYDGFGGSGIGTALARQALDDVRSKGGRVIPVCPFIWGFIERHPEYGDLVDHKIFDRIAAKLHPGS